MPLQLIRLFQAGNLAKEAIPYSLTALRQDLERLRDIWDDCQASRDRNAIYRYLNAVYGLVAWWAAEGRETERSRRALRLRCLDASDREDPFASVIRCTADPTKADKRTRRKWSRVMRYAAVYKANSEPLDRFIRRKGGINACAARFTRRPGAECYAATSRRAVTMSAVTHNPVQRCTEVSEAIGQRSPSVSFISTEPPIL